MEIFIPRVTALLDGSFRPEIILPDGSIFLAPMASADAAWEVACDTIELVDGDWTDSGLWYVCP